MIKEIIRRVMTMSEVILYGILCVIMIILLITYGIYVLIDEKKKIKYYKKTLLYTTEWDKYYTMLQKQKRIIFYKKIQLLWLKILVGIKGLIPWN